ncbi:MAG: hypothetical protein DDT32_00141 [Syntrophomonadaceae bacterium]|nr:hypothetical protein [Bacillota bacterium]MBT9146415.1 hypothetical protein [Bacillota bacterium]
MGSYGIGKLILSELNKGLPSITPAFGATLAEAAAVCFEDQNHTCGAQLEVRGTFQAKYQVFWQKVTGQMIRCYNDEESRTELGAYGVAFLLVLDLTDYTVIKRSRRGTGFDYWLGTGDSEAFPFQNKERLEVSGIRSGDNSRIRARVNEKLKQVEPSNATTLPALIVVVEFSAPLSEAVRNERS